MRKIITLLFLAAFCICSQAYSQNRADELMKQAQESLAKKEYIKARYLFLQAYNAFSSQAKYDKAVECGVNASALYHRENYYKEAFELLRGAELLVTCKCISTSRILPVPKNNWSNWKRQPKQPKMIHSTMICFTPKPITTIPLG